MSQSVSLIGNKPNQVSTNGMLGKMAFVDTLEYPSIGISGLDVDWKDGYVFYKSVSANSTFTFSNVTDGKVITLIVSNTSASERTMTFPAGIIKEAGALNIGANETAAYTFISANAKIYMSALTKLV